MTTGGHAGGLATALQMLGANGHGVASEAEQAEMFDADAAMPSMLAPAAEPRSGPQGGRPAGRRNKSTEAWRELFLSKFRHPLMVLGEMTARTPEDLAREMKLYKYHEGKLVLAPVLDAAGVHLCDGDGNLRWKPVLATGEAAKMQQDAAIALLPYLGQKLPMAIEVQPPRRGVVFIGDLSGAVPGASNLSLPLPPDDQTQQNQQVIDGDSVRLSDDQSHADDKPMRNMGEFNE